MKILLVEDDHVQAEEVRKHLHEEFHGPKITLLKTEKQFRDQFETIAGNPPDVICLDVMMRWTDPSPDLNIEQIPPNVRDEKGGRWRRAGVRCAKLLYEDVRTRDIPVILYTILEEEDLEGELAGLQNVRHVTKDSNLSVLADNIKSLSA